MKITQKWLVGTALLAAAMASGNVVLAQDAGPTKDLPPPPPPALAPATPVPAAPTTPDPAATAPATPAPTSAAPAAATPEKPPAKAASATAGASVGVGASAGGTSTAPTAAASASAESKEKGESKEGEHAEKSEKGEHAEGEEEEKRLTMSVDFVLGFGKTDVLTQKLPGSFATVPENTVGPSKMTTESFILAANYEVAKHFGIGVRLPFSFGTFEVDGGAARGTSALGNIELEAEYEHSLNKDLALVFALGVALPTAQGDEVPSEEEAKALGIGADLNAYDRFALNKAVAGSRGYEDNALYEPKHLGIIPKIALDWHASPKLTVQPYVKLENLLATTKGQPSSYVGELVFGARAGYRVSEGFEPGLRIWANAPLTGADFKTVAVVEPEIRMHYENLTPMIGVIIPFAGTLTDPMFVGVRLGLSGKF